MPHIYIHIPFCKSKCSYCDFFSVASEKLKNEFVQALCTEISRRKSETDNKIKTVYFGGGTPSLLSEQELSQIFMALEENFSLEPDAEITLEANPDDITPEKLMFWKSIGINRLSIGLQSFDDDELKYLGRRHNVSDSKKALENALNTGFNNISADIIHGIPGADLNKLLTGIEYLDKTGAAHLSMYSLTIEKGTILENKIKKGLAENIDEDEQAETYMRSVEKAEACGFLQYEISNFCKPGFESKHNSAYWKGVPYLGFGPAAHSFSGKKRMWNISSIQDYISGIKNKTPVTEHEKLSKNDIYNEFLLTRLRMINGIQLKEMRELFGNTITENLINKINKTIKPQHIQISESAIVLTRPGIMFADKIISDLMI